VTENLTTFSFVRHGSHDLLGKALAGRSPDLRLNALGRYEAAAIVERLGRERIAAVYSSPQPRALETAAPLAAHLRLEPRIEPALDEIDFGDWTGRTFAALASDPQWRTWVEWRSFAQPPGGEAFAAVHRRVVEGMERLRRTHAGDTVALISHGDVIKAALAHCLGMSLDHLERFEIAPASVSVVAMGDGWAQVRRVNDIGITTVAA
jgi:probable phosphoglycerate mutase